MRSNIYNLCLVDNKPTQNLQKLILGLAKPEFEDSEFRYTYDDFSPFLGKQAKILNPAQINVLERCLNAMDYNLILGMPGTGKTYTTAMLLKILISYKKRVLITSYTHLGLDNIIQTYLENFIEDKRKLVRLAANRVNNQSSDILELTYDNGSFENFENLEDFIQEKTLVFTTC